MSGTLLHVALAERALDDPAIDERTRALIASREADYRLGSVVFDLPYFDNLLTAGARMLLRLPLEFNVWGTLLHLRSPVRFIAHLLESSRPEVSVIGLGALTHFALDAVFHPEIHRLVTQSADGSMDLNSLHKHIEDDMDLHVFESFLGHTGVGTGYAAQKLVMRPSEGWPEGVAEAISSVHKSAPSGAQLRRWLLQLGMYGLLSASPRFPWVRTTPAARDLVDRDRAVALGNEAVAFAASCVSHGGALVQGRIDRGDFFGAVLDRSLLDGGPALPPRGG